MISRNWERRPLLYHQSVEKLRYKRLSNGRFQWPRSEAELRLLDPQSFRWLMEGLRIEQKTAIRNGKIMFRCSPFFSITAMPNIHFFGNWQSFDISVMGRSLYMVTGLALRESTVALRKSSWASISSGSPV